MIIFISYNLQTGIGIFIQIRSKKISKSSMYVYLSNAIRIYCLGGSQEKPQGQEQFGADIAQFIGKYVKFRVGGLTTAKPSLVVTCVTDLFGIKTSTNLYKREEFSQRPYAEPGEVAQSNATHVEQEYVTRASTVHLEARVHRHGQ